MPIDLDDELRSIAHALVAEAPDVPTYRHRDVTTRSTPRRHVALVAAIVVALTGAGALYLARAGDDPVRSTTEPTVPPVLIGDVTWPSVLPIVEDGYGSVNALAADQFRVAQATLARRVDGALVDPVIVEVGSDYAATHNGAESTDIVGVFGQTAHVYTSLDDVVPLAVVVGDDPYVAVAGVDPMSFLNRVGEDFVTPDVPADGGPITMAFGDLPEGYEVIYNDGERDDVTAFVSTLFDAPSHQDEAVFTSVGPWMIGRDAAPVDVDGRPGWLSTDGAHTSLSWAVVDATYAFVRAADPDAALELARSLRWVSVEEWAQHYGVDVEAIEPGAAPVRF